MHEIIFAKSVLRGIDDLDNVLSINLDLGELVGITDEELINGIKQIKPGIKININNVNSECSCSCGYKGEARIIQRLHDIVIFGCPNCDNQPKVIRGNKIIIKKIIYK